MKPDASTLRLSRLARSVQRRLTYANIVSTLALLLALGGVSYAATALPRNSVGPTQLRNNTVTSTKVKNGSLSILDLTTRTRQVLAGTDGRNGENGVPGATGATGPRGPSDVYTSLTTAPSTATLPAGTYLVFGFASSVTPGTTCALTAGAFSDTGSLPQGGAMTLMVSGHFNAPAPVTMTCSGAPGYNSRIYAIRTDAITIV